MRAAPERKVGITGAVGVESVPDPAGRIETFRVRPPLLVTVHNPLAEQQRRACRQQITADDVILQKVPTHAPHRWVEAHRLGEHRVGVRQVRQIRDRRAPAREDPVELGVQRGRDLRMPTEQMKGPGQCVGGGFVTGKQDREDLVADLGVVHAGAGLSVTGGQQQRQQVRPARSGGTATLDEVVDDPVEGVARVTAPPGRGKRQLFHQFETCLQGLAGGHHVFADSGPDDVHRIAVDVNVEQGPRDHRQRHLDHLVVDVEEPPVPPAVGPVVGKRGERLSVLGDPLVMEQRLHEPTLPAMCLAGTGQQPLPEYQGQRLHDRLTRTQTAADHTPAIRPARPDQRVGNGRRVRDEEQRHRTGGQPHDRTVGPAQADEARERISAQQSPHCAWTTSNFRHSLLAHQRGLRASTGRRSKGHRGPSSGTRAGAGTLNPAGRPADRSSR